MKNKTAIYVSRSMFHVRSMFRFETQITIALRNLARKGHQVFLLHDERMWFIAPVMRLPNSASHQMSNQLWIEFKNNIIAG